MDENGARFTALLENHFHLNKALSEDQRQAELKSQDFVWALHSQSQDLLLERCVRLCGNRFVWEDARSLGIFLWLQKIDVVVSDLFGKMYRPNVSLVRGIKCQISQEIFIYRRLRIEILLIVHYFI